MENNILTNNRKEDDILERDEQRAYSSNNSLKVYLDAKEIPLRQQLSNISFGIWGLCTQGSASINVYMQEYRMKQGELIVLLPKQLVAIKEQSNDFKMNYFMLSPSLIKDVASLTTSRISPLFFIHIGKDHYHKLTEEEYFRFNSYYNLTYNRMRSKNAIHEEEYIRNILGLFYLDLYNNFKNKIISTKSPQDCRKEELTHDFFLLIMEHYKENKEVAFYADKLCITPKYLSSVIKEVSSRSAKDWITEYILLEIKYLLTSSNINIQEIATRTNFSNQASLGRFFRKHMDMSPSEYRILKKKE